MPQAGQVRNRRVLSVHFARAMIASLGVLLSDSPSRKTREWAFGSASVLRSNAQCRQTQPNPSLQKSRSSNIKIPDGPQPTSAGSSGVNPPHIRVTFVMKNGVSVLSNARRQGCPQSRGLNTPGWSGRRLRAKQFDRNDRVLTFAKYLDLNCIADLFFIEVTVQIVKVVHFLAVDGNNDVAQHDIARGVLR